LWSWFDPTDKILKLFDKDRLLGGIAASFLIVKKTESVNNGDIVRVDFNLQQFKLEVTRFKDILGEK
jgi:hypothetical protein